MNQISIIDLIPRYENEKDDLLKIFQDVVSSGNLILSKENTLLEEEITKYLDTKYCLTLNSGTDALMMALFALGIGRGDEVITSPLSFIATAAAIDHVGAKPVFVDTKDDLNIDETKIEEKITSKTKAIIPVHWTGRMANIKKIKIIADKYNLKIIEDAAQAIGSQLDGYKPGTLSNCATFSTHPLKILNAIGDGGFITTNDKAIYEKIVKYRNHGTVGRDDYEIFGVNSRMDALNAAIVRYRLKKVDEIVKKRNMNIDFYRNNIDPKNFVIIDEPINSLNSMTMFVSIAEKRDELQKYLANNGIQSLIYYGRPLHLQTAAIKLGVNQGEFPNAELLSSKVLTIPFHQYLTHDELKHVSQTVNNFYSSIKK